MSIRKPILLLSLLGTLATPAFAGDQVGSGGVSRAQVLQELQRWERNPVAADGWREVGGEAGWVYVGRPTGASTAAAPTSTVADDGWREVGGEVGWIYAGTRGDTGKTRAEVRQELAQWQQHPVTADGWRDVGGEVGYVYDPSVRRAEAGSAMVSAEERN